MNKFTANCRAVPSSISLTSNGCRVPFDPDVLPFSVVARRALLMTETRGSRPEIADSYAMEAASNMHTCFYRSGYDISVNLAPQRMYDNLANIAPYDRKFFLTTKVRSCSFCYCYCRWCWWCRCFYRVVAFAYLPLHLTASLLILPSTLRLSVHFYYRSSEMLSSCNMGFTIR